MSVHSLRMGSSGSDEEAAAAAPTARPTSLGRCAAAAPAEMGAWTPVAAWRDAAHRLPKGGSGGGTAHLPLPLLLLLLLSLFLVSLWAPSLVLSVSGAACPSGTYNDGFAYVKDGGGFNIADPGFTLTGRSFTMEVWLKRDQNAFMCWMAQGSPGTLDQLLAFCSDSKLQFAQWGRDLAGTLGFTDTNTWHHVAMTHQHPSGQRNMYYDGANAGGGTVTAPFNPPVNDIAIGRSHIWPWKGMIDELRIYSVAHSMSVIGDHMGGNYFDVTASQQLLWLKFNDAVYSSGIVDSSGTAISAVSMVSGGGTTTTRNGPGDSGKCVRGWHVGFSLSRESAASVAVGTQSVYTIYQMDNWGNAMTGYSSMAATSVTVQPQGASGALDSIVVPLRKAEGTFVFTSPVPFTVTEFVLVDSANTGRSTALVNPPQQIFTAATGISAASVLTADSTQLELTPPFAPGMFGRSMGSTVRALVTSIQVRASWGGGATASYAAHGRTVGALTNGVESAAIALPATPAAFGAGIPCSARPALLAWIPFSNGETTTDASGLNVPTHSGNAPVAISDRFDSANNNAAYFSSRWIILTGGGFAVPPARMAVSIWFKLAASGSQRGLFKMGSSGSNWDRIWVEANGLLTARIRSQETIVVPNQAFNDNQWHHVVWQWSSSAPTMGQQLWLDGTLRVAGSRSYSDMTSLPTAIFGQGQDVSTTSINHEGGLDDCALFSRALHVTEIRALFAAAAPPYPQANNLHCVGLTSSTEGSYGFEIMRLPPVLLGLAFQSGRGASLSESPSALAPSPAFDNVVPAGYTLSLAAFETGLRASASFAPGENVYAAHGGSESVQLTSGSEEWSRWFAVPIGASTLMILTPDGPYEIAVTRATPVLSNITVWGQLEQDPAVEADLTPLLVPPFAPGVRTDYSMAILYAYGKVSLGASYSPADAVVTTMRNVAPEPLSGSGARSRWYGVAVGTDQAAIDMNKYKIAAPDGTTIVTITRLPPAVDSVAFSGLPPGTLVPFVPGNVTAQLIPVSGQALSSLAVTVGFNSGPVAVQVNGAPAGSASNGAPLDLTPYLQVDSDTTTVVLVTKDGSYSFTFAVGCPVPYSCIRVDQGPECEFRCQFCVAGIMRRICLQERPACCGTGNANCVC